MFLKRTLVLAAGVLLFLAGFIGYFDWRDMQIEGQFRQERQANSVDNLTLTTQIAATPAPAPIPSAPSAPSETSAPSAGTTGPVVPDISTTSPTTPAAVDITPAAPDTNVIIGPMPPSTTPDSTPAPASATPTNTNSSGPIPPSSTMILPHGLNLALLMLGGYTSRPSDGALAQTDPSATPIIISVPAPAPAPATNTPATNAPVTTAPATNAAAASVTTNEAPTPLEPGTARPAPVEASVIVLLYHQFVPAGVHIPSKMQWTINQDVFETEMKYIHDNGYHVIPMSQLLAFLRHEIGLPPNSVVITIDDGYKSAIVYADPILKKYGFPWTFFVYPEFITTTESKGAASWSDLLALQADGVDIESHSMTHPDLRSHHQKIKGVWHNLSPEEYDQWLTNETVGSKELLEEKMGRPITCFAYPYGDYNTTVEARVVAAGYQAIFTVADNPVHSTTKPTSIGRYTITQAVIKDFYAYLRQGALGLAEMDPAPGATITNPRPIITVVLGYAGSIDPTSIVTEVRGFNAVHHDFDPKTSTLRLYLPRDLVQTSNLVNIRARDAQTGQVMVANWHFNYESPAAAAAVHPPLGATAPATNSAPATAATTVPATTSMMKAPPASSSSAAATTQTPGAQQADSPQAQSSKH